MIDLSGLPKEERERWLRRVWPQEAFLRIRPDTPAHNSVKAVPRKAAKGQAPPYSLFSSEFDQAVATVLRKNFKTAALDVYVYFDTRLRIELPPNMKTKTTEKRSWVSAYHYSPSQRHALITRVYRVRTKLKKLQTPGR